MTWKTLPSGWAPVAVTSGGFRLSDGERVLKIEGDGGSLGARIERAAYPVREPLRFEAGQVVRVKFPERSSAIDVLVRAVGDDFVYGRIVDRPDYGTSFTASVYERSAELLSPAPRASDTWASGESVARIEANGAQLRIVSEGEPFVGDVVAVARKLWEGGYRRAEARETTKPRGPTRVRAVHVNGKTVPLKRLDTSNAPAYVTLDDLKNCVPTHYEQTAAASMFRNAMEDAAVQMTRLLCGPEEAQKVRAEQHRAAARDSLPSAGDVYEHDDGTIVEVREGNSRLYTHVLRAAVPFPLLIEAEEPSAFAEMLREYGYTKSDGKWYVYAPPTELVPNGTTRNPFVPVGRLLDGTGSAVEAARSYSEKVDAAVKHAVAAAATASEAADAIRRISSNGMPVRTSDIVERMFPRYHDSARRCDSPLDRSWAVCATGDNLRRLAEVYGVLPELCPGMVVRREPCENLKRVAFGRVLGRHGTDVRIHWLGDSGPWHYASTEVGDLLRDGRWRIVDPDVRPLASLAYAVAAIAKHRADSVTSRRYVDDALALLRGEPFAEAIRAALVGVSESTNLTPSEISACIAALRHWEARRPFDRDLGALQRRTSDFRRGGGPWNRLQLEATEVLRGALGYAPVWDYDNLWFLYERARASR